jgi:hypothetical protein
MLQVVGSSMTRDMPLTMMREFVTTYDVDAIVTSCCLDIIMVLSGGIAGQTFYAFAQFLFPSAIYDSLSHQQSALLLLVSLRVCGFGPHSAKSYTHDYAGAIAPSPPSHSPAHQYHSTSPLIDEPSLSLLGLYQL